MCAGLRVYKYGLSPNIINEVDLLMCACLCVQEVHECTAGPNVCAVRMNYTSELVEPHAKCEETPGSYECSCGFGFFDWSEKDNLDAKGMICQGMH